MAKKEFVSARKEIERLMFEGIDCTSSHGISKWSDIWSSSFQRQNILHDGKVVDFTYSEDALLLQSILNDGIEKSIELAKSVSSPDFFDYWLGDVTISGHSKTYNLPHVWSTKKYFDISQVNAKKYYTSKLLLAAINVAPEGSKAAQLRQSCRSLTVLSFAGSHSRWTTGVDTCIFDFRHIANFVQLEKLGLYGLRDWTNVDLISSLKTLKELNVEGAKASNQWKFNDNYIEKITTRLSSSLPNDMQIQEITVANVANVTNAEDLYKINADRSF